MNAVDTETIVAIATGPGRGGIGIVRLSGPESLPVARRLVRLSREPEPGRVRRGELLDAATGAVLDEVVLTYFAAPHSYTAEDVVEIACHGAPVLLEYAVREAVRHGARPAEPGEFTQRAFLNGRLDLTQAEAVHDLVAAQTLEQARVAAAQLGGALARRLAPLKDRLVNLIAELEAGVDFAEDDLELMPEARLLDALAGLRTELQALEASFRYGRVLRDGLRLALVGRPNAGKSSLFNRLLGQERAIVTAQPGTTRDLLTERLELAGVPVTLLDTAGLREAPEGEAGAVERLGIARTWEAVAEADVVVVLTEAGEEPEPELLARLAGRPHLLVETKADLRPKTVHPGPGKASSGAAIVTSAVTGEGLDRLREALAGLVRGPAASEGALLTNVRQHGAVAEALEAVTRAADAARAQMPHEMLLLDLYAGLTALDRLTGATEPDEILGRIFSRFCIGK